MDDENVVAKNIRVEYITTKLDKYNNEITYFKIKEKNIEHKFKPIMKENYKLPWFKTEKGHNLLKVKHIYVKIENPPKNKELVVDINFKYYSMDDIQGYYISLIG